MKTITLEQQSFFLGCLRPGVRAFTVHHLVNQTIDPKQSSSQSTPKLRWIKTRLVGFHQILALKLNLMNGIGL